MLPDRPHVKYPFEVAGRWPLRYHRPYTIEHEGRQHRVVAGIFASPSVHGQIKVSCEGRLVAAYDNLTPGDVVEITGDSWRVAEVDYRTRVVLERVAGGGEEDSGVQAGQ